VDLDPQNMCISILSLPAGLNYQDHCDEQNKPAPKEPMFFSKFNNALVGPQDNVIAHSASTVSRTQDNKR